MSILFIPPFVDRNKKKSERASARLRYMLAVLAAKHTGRQSMRALSEMVGLDHSTLSTYIRKGSFSERSANRIAEAIGTDEITADMLMNPLEVGRVYKALKPA
jgi:lambda repressor-like predicted transcriptional regulator